MKSIIIIPFTYEPPAAKMQKMTSQKLISGKIKNWECGCVFPLLCIKPDGTKGFIKMELYKVCLLFKRTLFICSPPFMGWVLDVLKEFKVRGFKIFALWGADTLKSFRVIMIWKITCLLKIFVCNLLYIQSCSLSVPSPIVLWAFLLYITSWDLHKNVTSFVLLLKSCLQLRTLKKEWKDFLSFLRWTVWTCWRYPVWNISVHELETSWGLCL